MNWRSSAAAAALMIMAAGAAGAAPAAHLRPVQVAGLFGESEEEKAARLKAEQRENDQDAGLAELRQRVSDMEQALRNATGQNEQLTHQVRQLSDRIDRMQKDFDYKLCTVTAQQMSAAPGATGGLNCDAAVAGNGGGVAPQASPPQSGGTLGSLPVGGAGAPAGAGARPQYDEAMNLLARARYDEARAAFRGFADTNPKDPLAPQAVYWVGNIAYVQKDYPSAAQAFAEQIKKYPSSAQGAESMLKLGQSLIAMGEKKEGCLTLGAIKSKYKQAPANILTQASATRNTSCPK